MHCGFLTTFKQLHYIPIQIAYTFDWKTALSGPSFSNNNNSNSKFPRSCCIAASYVSTRLTTAAHEDCEYCLYATSMVSGKVTSLVGAPSDSELSGLFSC